MRVELRAAKAKGLLSTNLSGGYADIRSAIGLRRAGGQPS